MHHKTHYETLEVSANASAFVIRAAYRCLAQQHHPDKHCGSDNAGEILTQLNVAYSVLCNPARRQIYDQGLKLHNCLVERRNSGTSTDDMIDTVAFGNHTSRPFGFRPLI